MNYMSEIFVRCGLSFVFFSIYAYTMCLMNDCFCLALASITLSAMYYYVIDSYASDNFIRK